MNYTNNSPFFFNKTTTKSTTCANASPPNAHTPPATKKHSPPIIESWECPYVISKKTPISPPCRLFQCFRYFTSAYNCNIILNINHLVRTEVSRPYHAKSFLGDLIQPLFKNSFYHQGFFAVRRRAVFILGAKWKALVRGWRRDCVVGGMETRFQ